ncbi:hypothetical protein LCGC14_0446740 [marine sediment metagenome]|uniref:Uncharacterized protein n=1 Tax=marine sediment metagenome TaxID=412755 RepID=A0A0F9VT28_9ZZZZ
MKFLYLPALADGTTRWIPGGKASRQFLGKTTSRNPLQDLSFVNWMDDEVKGTDAYYPHTLITYYYFRDKAIALPKDAYVFGDSGGFSAMRYGMSNSVPFYEVGGVSCSLLKGFAGAPHQQKLDPVDVLKWQEALCTVGVVLDIPPVDMEGKRIWEFALETTLANTKRALPAYLRLRKGDTAFRWWGAVHGWTAKHMERWWSDMARIYPFEDEGEGWAFKARDPSSNAKAVAYCLHFIKQHNMKRAHFLAAVAPQAAATLMVLGPQTSLEFLTSDAQTADIAARNRHVIQTVQDGLATKPLEERGDNNVGRMFLRQCDCYSCTQILEDEEKYPDLVSGKYSEYWTHRFVFHNHIMLFRLIARLQHEADTNPDALLHEVLGTDYGPVLRAFDGHPQQDHPEGMERSLLDFI